MDDRMIPLSVLREYMPKLKDEDLKELGPVEYDQSKVPEVSKKHAENVRRKVYLPDMTESFARGVEYAGLIASEAVYISNETKGRQDTVESQFNSVQQELTDKDVISAPEIIVARNGEATLSDRLDKDHLEFEALSEQTANGLRPSVSVWEEFEQRSVNVKWFGAKGDGSTDDIEAINEAIRFCNAQGLKLFFPKGVYLVSKPVNVLPFVIVEGAGVQNTEIKKTTSTADSNGINAVMVAYRANNFQIRNLTLIGDRKNYSEGNAVTTDGLHIQSGSYFEVDNVRVSDSKRGFVSQTNWCCKYSRTVALRCQGYAYTMVGSSTSHIWEQPTAWGCGGSFYIASSIYWTIISPACDHSDAGGYPSDPFLPQGSGGNYLEPSYIFFLSGAKGTVISSGTENGFSQYIYSEGSHVTFLNPYVYSLECHAENFSFIETRGEHESILELTNPSFSAITNKRTVNAKRRGLFFEDASKQKIKTNRFIPMDSSFGMHVTVNDGLQFSNSEKLINITPFNISENSKVDLSYDSSVAKTEFVKEGNETYLKLSKSTSNSGNVEFLRKLPSVGNFKIKTEGIYSSSYSSLMIDVIESNGTTTNVLKSITYPSLPFKSTDYLTVNSTLNCYLRIRVGHNSDVLKFKELIVESVI